MNCDEVRAAQLAGEPEETLREHLAGCGDCRSRLPALDAARAGLSDPAIWEEPSPQLAGRIVGLIGAEPSEGVASTWRRRLGWLAVAAAVVIVAAVGVVNLLRAPDWVVEMPGTSLQPTAQATVAGWNTDAGTRLQLEISGLGDAPAGHVYELWLSQEGDHVSAGTFRSGGEVELWVGVSRRDYPRLWVTLEEIGPYAGPSSATVLDTGA